MGQHLVLTVRFHGDGQGIARFHGIANGAPEWPPAPGRVFQALVAGAACGSVLPEAVVPALEWLEQLSPPVVAAPSRQLGQSMSLFVPNNDADALSDPRNVSEIRTKKAACPSLFSEDVPLLYAWSVPDVAHHAETIIEASAGLYQLGRGIDLAWAVGELLDDSALDARLEAHGGAVHRPETGTRGERMLACPVPGSLASLVQRRGAPKLRKEGSGRNAHVVFTNPPKPRFLSVSYARSRKRVIFELRDRKQDKPWPWALVRVVQLVERLRDEAAARLRNGLPGYQEQIESTLIGRKADGRHAQSITHRARIIPLPSIGSTYADRAIRRFVLEMPTGAPLRSADVEWAFSGPAGAHSATGEVGPFVVARNDEDDMFEHYAGPSRQWRSVTAVALPESAQRRRIEPTRQRDEAKSAAERATEENQAVAAVHTALRHAGVQVVATSVRVQREPFEGRGARAESFAQGTRFAKERLWHVEVTLDRNVDGPLVIGDGRFLGLGIMAPVTESPTKVEQNGGGLVISPPGPLGIIALEVLGNARELPVELARALRRAVMARVRDTLGTERIPSFFTGHASQASNQATERAWHLSFQWDSQRYRLIVVAPHRLDRRAPTWDERRNLETLTRALEELVELRAGVAGRFGVRVKPVEPSDPLFTSARCWVSCTPYAVTRHSRCASAGDALIRDLTLECGRRRLPPPQVTIRDTCGIPKSGLVGHVQLEFPVAVSGPIILGRTRYLGGGLFAPSAS